MKLFSTGWIAALAVGALLASCAEAPKQPDPTVAQITFAAADDLNPDPGGRASPAVVFVYGLKAGAPFSTAPMDQLLGGQVTDDTITRVARIVLVPGKTIKKLYTLPIDTTDIGIAVAYRQIETAKWRDQKSVTPNAVSLVKAGVGSNDITIE